MILTRMTSFDSGTDLVTLAQDAYDHIRSLVNTEGEQLSPKLQDGLTNIADQLRDLIVSDEDAAMRKSPEEP